MASFTPRAEKRAPHGCRIIASQLDQLVTMLILSGTVDSETGPQKWRLMRIEDRYMCSRDGESIQTTDRKEVLRFLACDGGASAVDIARNFLDSMHTDGGCDASLPNPCISD